ncbi:MAG: hypothetical protein HC893_01425 [Chloroflexaceae bacterium]|nr:hypothetical protein [Chloroflexaceae bacterium]
MHPSVLVFQVRYIGVVLLLGCLFGVLAGCGTVPRGGGVGSLPRSPAQETTKTLSAFFEVSGTEYLQASVATNETRAALNSRTTYTTIHNYVFVDQENETVLRLLPTNDTVILTTIELFEQVPAEMQPTSTDAENTIEPTTAWFLYSIVKADTNGDEQLAFEDKQTLAVSDAGGNGYTELVEDVDELVYYTLRPDNETALLIYRQGDQRVLARVNLPDRTIDNTVEFPPLGDDVE